jgi:hypothetical protein
MGQELRIAVCPAFPAPAAMQHAKLKRTFKERLTRYRQIKAQSGRKEAGGSDGDSGCEQGTLQLRRSHRSL